MHEEFQGARRIKTRTIGTDGSLNGYPGGLFVVEQMPYEELQGNGPFELPVFGLVYNTDPGFTKFLGDLVMRDGAANHFSPILAFRRYLSRTTDRMNDHILLGQPVESERFRVRSRCPEGVEAADW